MLLSLAVAFMVTPWLALKLLAAARSHAAGAHGRDARPTRLHAFLRPRDERRSCSPGARASPLLLFAGIAGWSLLLSVAGRRATGGAEDAAVRQQVRVPGGGRHARGHAAGEHHRACCTNWRASRHRAGGDSTTRAMRHRRADQFQRAGAAVLPAQRQRARRPAGEPGRQAPAQSRRATRSRARAARAGRRSAARYGASVKVVEVPPGPPVLSPLVAEVYGPDYAGSVPSRAVRDSASRRTPGHRRHRHQRRGQCAARGARGRPRAGRAPGRAAAGDRRGAGGGALRTGRDLRA